ncbi:hypothetical protein PQX77_021621 [Marasmius sp. AFHP31]|nr:hypothetical protein PQX77_021621 [Marasmius sp. AFHP31]
MTGVVGAMQELETHPLVKRLLTRPDEFADHVRRTAGAIILRISHGYEVQEGEDPFVSLADQATEQFSVSTAPGFLVNLVPALAKLPEWFPGAGFHKLAKQWGKTLNDMVDQPFSLVKSQVAAGTAPVSYVSSKLYDKQLTREFEVKWSAASLYSGGADTQHTFKKPAAKAIEPPTPRRFVWGLDTLAKEKRAAQRSSNSEQSPKSNVRTWGTQRHPSNPSASKTSSNSTSWTPTLKSMYQLWVLGTLNNVALLDIFQLCTFP